MNNELKIEIKKNNEEQEFYKPVFPSRKYLLMVFFVLAGLIGAIYSNTLHAGYQLDDVHILCLASDGTKGYTCCKNPLHDLTNLRAIWNSSPTTFLTFLTFALNYHFGGANVLGYHLVNISIHIATSAMVYLFALVFFQTPRFENHPLAEHAKAIAVLSSLFFAVHPIQTSAVT